MADLPVRVVGRFGSDADLQEAIGRLTVLGVDRAEMTLPAMRTDAHAGLEDQAENPDTGTDGAQMRTLGSSLAAAAAGIAVSGLVIASGGAALPAVGAAIAAGAGAGGFTHLVSQGRDAQQHEDRDAAAAQGDLVLSVLVRPPTGLGEVERAIRESRGAVV